MAGAYPADCRPINRGSFRGATMRVTSDKHLTAANRRALTAMVLNKWTAAKTPRITYTLEPLPDCGSFRFTMDTRERDDYGRPVTHRHVAIVSIAGNAQSTEPALA
jgi:hypothetical protein